jgi:hypothetical protein
MTSIIKPAIVIIAFVLFIVLAINVFSMPEPVSYERYVVQRGDTLWEIAHQSDGWNKYDGQAIIDDIQERSDCTATIYPGQVVYIPMYEN